MSKKLVIGIYANHYDGKVFQTMPYMQFASQFGQVRLINTTENLKEVTKNIHMLIVPGGSDVDSEVYDETPGIMAGRINPHFEYLDKELLTRVLDAKKPITGFCRGMQAINTTLGGTLHQHVVGHNQCDNGYARSSRTQNLYTVKDVEDGVFQVDFSHSINSIHHQAVAKLASVLLPLAVTRVKTNCYSLESEYTRYATGSVKEDGELKKFKKAPVFIEAFNSEDFQISGFQWHPEEFNDEFARHVINVQLETFYPELKNTTTIIA